MSHTCLQYKLRFGPKKPVFHGFVGLYFLTLFSEHPVVYVNVYTEVEVKAFVIALGWGHYNFEALLLIPNFL